MGLYLSLLLNDPYDAVRIISYRSLRSVPGFAGFNYDFLADPKERLTASLRGLESWRRMSATGPQRTDGALLFDAKGSPTMDVVVELGRRRNDRPVVLRE